MAVTTTINLVAEDGDGVEQDFDFAFKIFAQTELLVYEETSAGVYVLRTLTTHYTVAFNTVNETGTVSWVTAPGNGLESVIIRNTAKTQGSAFAREAIIPAKTTENALDKLTLVVQDLQEKLDRTVLQPVVPPTPDKVILAAPVDAKGVFYTDNGDGTFTLTPTTDDLDSAATDAAASAAAAAASAAAAVVSAAAALASEVAAAASAASLIATSGLFSARPAAPTQDVLYYSTDRDSLDRYVVVAGKWFLLG